MIHLGNSVRGALAIALSTAPKGQSPSLDCKRRAQHFGPAFTVWPDSYPPTLHRAIDNGPRLAQGAQFLPCASLIATRVVELVDKVSGSDIFRPSDLAPPWGRECYWEGLGHDSGFRSDATMLADVGTGATASALSVTLSPGSQAPEL